MSEMQLTMRAAITHPRHVSFNAFRMEESGLWMEAQNKKGKTGALRISGAFEVLGKARTRGGSGWGVCLRWHDDDGRSHLRVIPYSSIVTDQREVSQALAGGGLYVNRELRDELMAYLSEVSVPDRITLVSRTGWHEIAEQTVFVLPEETIGDIDGESVLLQGLAESRYAARGSLAEWAGTIGEWTAGQMLPMLAISTALSGSLLRLAEMDGGGLHLFGASSRGKTTTLQAAASVWGSGDICGYLRPWRSTANALEGLAALASDTVLVLDELGMVEPKDLSAAVYGLSGGVGKQRATVDGSLAASQTWRVMILSSGELPIATKLAEGGLRPRAGQLVRVLERFPAWRNRTGIPKSINK